MAGIGHSTDHPSPWNTQSQFTMGRAMMHDLSKPITNLGGNLNKRALFGSGASGSVAAPSFSDVANLCAPAYTSRPGSSQLNGEILSSVTSGLSGRSPFGVTSPEINPDVSCFFNTMGFNGSQSGPARNFSEPALFPSLSTACRTVGADPSSGRIGSVTPSSTKPPSDGTCLNTARNSSGLFQSPLATDSTAASSGNLSSSSRGMKLDPSEFPPILTSVGRGGNSSISGAFHSSNQAPLRNYVSVMSKNSSVEVGSSPANQQFGSNVTPQNPPPEFSKQDFPALPGQHPSGTTISTTSTSSATSVPAYHRSVSLNPSPCLSAGTLSSLRSFAQTSSSMLPPTSGFPSNGPISGIQLLPNHLVANIPKNMICDQFGMLGLLKLIRVGDYDATLNMLAPGLDLSSLHSNWQSPGELHTTFVSPCHDSCIGRPHDMDYAVPPEYLIRHLITERLPDPPMDQLSEETLFWLFYNCCQEEVQLVVAKELYQREWRFHKKEQIWLTRVMGANFTTDSNSEQGDYYFWDPIKAQKSTHHMTILYSDLDDAPSTFRLSSNTLSAYVTAAVNPLTGSLSNTHPQHLTAYQQQQQQQQSLAYPLLSRQQLGSGPVSVSQQQHSTSHMMLNPQGTTGTSGQSSSTTLANLLSARQQQQQKQLSPTATSYFPSSNPLGRSVAIAPLFGGKSIPSSSAASSIGPSAVSSTHNPLMLPTAPSTSGPQVQCGSSVDCSTISRPGNPDSDGLLPGFEATHS